jgi:hypothetical protein
MSETEAAASEGATAEEADGEVMRSNIRLTARSARSSQGPVGA